MPLNKLNVSVLNISRKSNLQEGERGMIKRSLKCTMKYLKVVGSLIDWVWTLKDGPIVLCSTMQQQPGHGTSEMSALKNLLAPNPN
jgi:hypothetical protein